MNPQMRNSGSPPAHLSSSTAAALGEPRWLQPPQRAPNEWSLMGLLALDAALWRTRPNVYEERRGQLADSSAALQRAVANSKRAWALHEAAWALQEAALQVAIQRMLAIASGLRAMDNKQTGAALADEAGRRLADKRRRHEAAERNKALAAKALANKQRCQDNAVRAKALANEQRCHEAAEHATVLAAKALADKQHRHDTAVHAKALAMQA
jgi:hypothetical protein